MIITNYVYDTLLHCANMVIAQHDMRIFRSIIHILYMNCYDAELNSSSLSFDTCCYLYTVYKHRLWTYLCVWLTMIRSRIPNDGWCWIGCGEIRRAAHRSQCRSCWWLEATYYRTTFANVVVTVTFVYSKHACFDVGFCGWDKH